ncbi:MAG: Ig-like domain-containing protein, partial [Roseburia sp.]|nr:Ig-like domain-containing protein [Roseburia sp.]
WRHSNPARQYNAKADTWYYISGTYKMPSSLDNYNGNSNRLYICRDGDTAHLPAGKNAVYYIDSLTFTVMDSEVESVTVSTKDDKTEVYPGETLQCSAKVTGKNDPSQRVTYSVDPAVEGVSIDENGLLTVGNAAAGEITVKATSVENPAKSGTVKVTVLAQSVDSVKITAAGKVTKIFSDDKRQFSAKASTTGGLKTKIEWSVRKTDDAGTATISEDGKLTVRGLTEGTTIEVVAKAVGVTDPTKQAEAAYELTVLGENVEPHVIKAVQENLWTEITENYYYNLSFDAAEESAYFENAPSGTTPSCVGFLANPDGSSFDASAYNILKVHLISDASANAKRAYASLLKIYSGSASVTSTNLPKVEEYAPKTSPRERVWMISLKDDISNSTNLSLQDIKALSLESQYDTAGVGLKIYSFTFERISPYQPTELKINYPGNDKIISTSDPRIKENRTLSLTATATNLDGDELDNINLNWSSSDETVATVSEDGVITGVSAGQVTITASVAGYEDITASYTLRIYDDTPVDIGLRLGVYTRTTEQTYLTREELLPVNGGLEIKAVLLNDGGEIVGEAEPDDVIFSQATTTSETYTGITPQLSADKKVTAIVDENGTKNNSYFYIKVQWKELTSSAIRVFVYDGYRIPLTVDTVYNASSGKETNDITLNNGIAAIKGFDGGCNAIGFKGTLPEGTALSDYQAVYVITGKGVGDRDHKGGEYPTSLFMPANGWATSHITCGTTDSKSASTVSGKTSTFNSLVSQFNLSLTEEEKNTRDVHFAVSFGENCMDNLVVEGVILAK